MILVTLCFFIDQGNPRFKFLEIQITLLFSVLFGLGPRVPYSSLIYMVIVVLKSFS